MEQVNWSLGVIPNYDISDLRQNAANTYNWVSDVGDMIVKRAKEKKELENDKRLGEILRQILSSRV
mgnify:FL=1